MIADLGFVKPLLPGTKLSSWGGSLAWPLPSGLVSDEVFQSKAQKKKAAKAKAAAQAASSTGQGIRYTATAYVAPLDTISIHVYTSLLGARPYMQMNVSTKATVGTLLQQALDQYLWDQSRENPALIRQGNGFLLPTDFVVYRGQQGLHGIAPVLDPNTGRPGILSVDTLLVDLFEDPFLVIVDQAALPKLQTAERYQRATIRLAECQAAEAVGRTVLQRSCMLKLEQHLRSLRVTADFLLKLWKEQRDSMSREDASRRYMQYTEEIDRATFERMKKRNGFEMTLKDPPESEFELYKLTIKCRLAQAPAETMLLLRITATGTDVRQAYWEHIMQTLPGGKVPESWLGTAVGHFTLVPLQSQFIYPPSSSRGAPLKLLEPIRAQLITGPPYQVEFVVSPDIVTRLRRARELDGCFSTMKSRLQTLEDQRVQKETEAFHSQLADIIAHERSDRRAIRAEHLVGAEEITRRLIDGLRDVSLFLLGRAERALREFIRKRLAAEARRRPVGFGFRKEDADLDEDEDEAEDDIGGDGESDDPLRNGGAVSGLSRMKLAAMPPPEDRVAFRIKMARALESAMAWPIMQEDLLNKGFMPPLITPLYPIPVRSKEPLDVETTLVQEFVP